jgi:small subunit ribosomal protein S8
MAALTDPIADLLSRVRNGLSARHEKIDVPSSRLKIEIARILKDEGYIKNFKVMDDRGGSLLRLYLKYDDTGNPVIHGLSRSSKPGRRLYKGKNELPEVLGGLGVAIVSTSQGLLTGNDAKKRGVGGEVVCTVW